MEKRFRSLRIIGTVLKIIAWIILVVGIVGGLIMLAGGLAAGTALGGRGAGLAGVEPLRGLFGGLVGGITAMVTSILGFLGLYAYGDAIYLALAIEENTRETAHYLKGGDTYGRRT